ncbi:MAG TPA: N-acetyl-alpha-D-glucosaminyl L-malate synthase BshA [Bacillota bacterium]|nr:N-acetyl-alpha-D-glucosaminyl L-malate synthase BshA [Bacillota bacterium]
MRIGMICYPTYGGSGVVATELGEYLADRGHQVHFISYERPFRLTKFHGNLFLHEVDVVEYPLFKFPPYSIALASTIAEVVRTHKLDILHAHYAIPHAVSAYLACQMLRDKRIPIVTTLHGTDVTVLGRERQFWDITRFCLEESDAVTAVSNSLSADTREMLGTREVETIYNFIDPETYRRQPNRCRSYFGKPEDKIIIHISNFRPVKRVADVIRVFAGINARVPSQLLLGGDGPDRLMARQLAEQLGVSSRVHFLGKQEGVIDLLSIGDLFLLPSEKESFGLAALEAMACELPVIATNCGGLPEVVKDGITGFLTPLGAVEQMVERGVQLLTDSELYGKMAAAARQWAVSNFNSDKIVSQYEACYARACSRPDKYS